MSTVAVKPSTNSPQHLDLNFVSGFFETCQVNHRAQGAEKLMISVGESGTLKSTLAHAFLAETFAEKSSATGGPGGAILFSSEGVTASELRNTLQEWNVKPQSWDDQVLVRSILPRFLSSNNFHFRIKVCIRYMKTMLQKIDRSKQSGEVPDWSRIRVVIDNWNSIVDSHSALKRDPQLLQSIVSLLRNEGVRAYIVATQSGSPKSPYPAARVHDVSQLEAMRIHSWPVDFFGDRRIAISTSLPGSNDQRTKIYEIAKDPWSKARIQIIQDFDIYEDLESGKAKRVDLKVKLYSGYHADHSLPNRSSATYINEVFALFGDLFPSSKDGQDVVSFESIERYDAFKEYIQNLESAKLSESLVFQVDEFWTGRQSDKPLAKLDAYFDSSPNGKSAEKSRSAWFVSDMTENRYRVPLHKDFGLLLADRTAWWKAKDFQVGAYQLAKWNKYWLVQDPTAQLNRSSLVLPTLRKLRKQMESDLPAYFPTSEDLTPLTVADVWNSLCVPGEEFETEVQRKSPYVVPSWELFLNASRIVAMGCGKNPFDVDLRTSETLTSLMLEVWLSKVLDGILGKQYPRMQVGETPPLAGTVPNQSTAMSMSELRKLFAVEKMSLRDMHEKWPKEFEFAIGLVSGFLPSRYREYDLKLASADNDAVAFRTWFAPAITCQAANRNLAPLRLPGRFSVRGDWYLGVAQGSRSFSLASNAIDKLVSKAMNRKRLRDGVGLPVLDTNEFNPVESALTTPEPKTNSYRKITFEEVRSIEPVVAKADKHNLFPEFTTPLQPLFRSKIKNYDRDSSEFFMIVAKALRNAVPLVDPTSPPSKELDKSLASSFDFLED